jgi:Tfp pilus assembly PilM family ATPase
VRPRSVGAVRMTQSRGRTVLAAAASLDLPEGVLGLSMVQPNVLEPEAFRETIRGVLERIGTPLAGPIGLVLPDPVARVSLMPVTEFLGKDSTEVESLVRFRLRKAVPFDIKDAKLAVAFPEGGATDSLALVVAIALPVLEGYEQALVSLGLQPGLVELAGLAILGAVDAARPPGDRLVVNWDEGYVSLLLSRGGQPALVRVLTTEEASMREDVVREAANTVLYYRDKLGGTGLQSVLVRSAVLTPAAAVALLQEPLGLVPDILDPWAGAEGGDASDLGQAVAGAAACVTGKPA